MCLRSWLVLACRYNKELTPAHQDAIEQLKHEQAQVDEYIAQRRLDEVGPMLRLCHASHIVLSPSPFYRISLEEQDFCPGVQTEFITISAMMLLDCMVLSKQSPVTVQH